MSEASLGCIVEGHGDALAVAVLARRLALRIDPALSLTVRPILPVPRSRLLKPGELERYVELAAVQLGGGGALLVLLDADDDCPATLGPTLLRRVIAQRSDLLAGTVLAKREFEAWFLASAESLRGRRGLRDNLEPPLDPEGVRGAKEWLRRHMRGRSVYKETTDQAALCHAIDIELARRRSDSFDKCCRDIERLVTSARRPTL